MERSSAIQEFLEDALRSPSDVIEAIKPANQLAERRSVVKEKAPEEYKVKKKSKRTKRKIDLAQYELFEGV